MDRTAAALAEAPAREDRVSPRVRHLLEASRAAFVKDGFDAVSIDAIARNAGVSKETIYRHFPDKEALFRAALDDMAGQFASRTEALHRAGLTPVEELAGMARAILDAAVDGGLLSPLWVAAGLGGRMPDFAAELQLGLSARMEPVRQALEAVSLARGSREEVGIEDALDFGSLAVEGPALLLGFPAPAPEHRALLSMRVAELFSDGIRGMPKRAQLGPDQDSVSDFTGESGSFAPHLRRLLDVAAAHFLRSGYEAASLADIGSEAKVGRGTLYRHFGHKAGLFDAVLRDRAASVAVAARPPALEPGGGVATLERFLFAAGACLTGAASVALHRAAMAASRRDAALARAIHDMVRAPWAHPLSDWIAAEGGHNDSDWLARQALVLAMQGNRAIAAGQGLTGDAARRHAHRIARIFLDGYRA